MQVNIDVSGIKEAQGLINGLRLQVDRVAAMALNRAADSGRVLVNKDVRQRYALKLADVRSAIKINKANMRHLAAEVVVDYKPIELIKFQHSGGNRTAKGKRRAFRVKVGKSGGFITLRRTFTATIKRGESAWMRVGRTRSPLRLLFGPSIGGMVRANIQGALIARMRERFESEFRQGMRYAPGKGRVHEGF